MELDKILSEALDAVNKAQIPSNLQEVAFSRALDVLLAGTGPAPSTAGAASSGNSSGTTSATDLTGGMAEIAKAFQLDPEKIEDFFSEHDGELRVEVDTARLGSTTLDRAQGVALLLISGRQIGHYGEGVTSLNQVREECDRHGVYDSKNFASYHLKKLFPLLVVSGSGSNRSFRLKPSGREEAKKLLASLSES